MEQYPTHLKTPLYDKHIALGAKVVPFAGWEMPVQYRHGILKEHLAVRNNVGLFDVSHMGRVMVTGPDADRFLDYLSTSKVAGRQDGLAIYGVLCNEQGGAVDDAIIYRYSSDSCFIVVNAGNRDKDLRHLLAHANGFNVTVTDRYAADGVLALQGPKAHLVIQSLFPKLISLAPMHFVDTEYRGVIMPAARTGYTGAGGFEFYPPIEILPLLWDELLQLGAPHGIEPVGLGARDTLRLEMGYALYGHELSDTIAPIESVAAWAVKMDKERFLGKEALISLLSSGKQRRQYGVELIDKGIARDGCDLFHQSQRIGTITSGTHSPSLGKGIAIAMVNKQLAVGEEVQVQVRQNRLRARIAALPFYTRS